MRQMEEKMIKRIGRYMQICGLEKAYVNVCREKLWEVLQSYGVSYSLMKVIRGKYQASAYQEVCS